MGSLRHRRLMRIVSIMQHGTMPAYQRAFMWRGGTYCVDDIASEGIHWHRHRKPNWSNEYRGWDRRWRSSATFWRITIRDRSRRGACLRRQRREAVEIFDAATAPGARMLPNHDPRLERRIIPMFQWREA